MSSVTFAITSGNLNGIGPEIIIKSLLGVFDDFPPKLPASKFNLISDLKKRILKQKKIMLLIIGSLPVFDWHAHKCGLGLEVIMKNMEDDRELKKNFPHIAIYQLIAITSKQSGSKIVPITRTVLFIDIPVDIPTSLSFSEFMKNATFSSHKTKKKSNKHFLIAQRFVGRHAYEVLKASALLLRSRRVGGVVNAPISKESVSQYSPLRNFKGHTEFYANIFKTKKFSMVFLSPLYNLVLLTTHIPLSQVTSRITRKVVEKGIDHAYQIRNYLKDKKKILFLGINPHAGENGKIGKEDNRIRTYINQHRFGRYVEGPVAADTAFIKVLAGEYRVVIAAYHDQGLIPLKSTGENLHYSVDVTWGLPFVRTTVDHGTAFDIVGKNLAQPYSFMTALGSGLSLFKKNKKANAKDSY